MPGTVLLAAAAGALGLALALLVLALLPARSRQSGVARALAAIEQDYGRQPAAGAGAAGPSTTLPGWLRVLALRLSPGSITTSLQRRLNVAGNPPSWTADRVLAVKGLGLVVLAAVGALYGLHSIGLLALAVVAGGAAGFFLPDLLLYNAGQRRQTELQRVLPDALDMLTVCVEAGLGFDAALAQVARTTRGPLAAEFTRALQEMQIGKTRSQALRAMADRTTVAELRTFVSAVAQSGDLGIPIAQVLRAQAQEMRVHRRQRAEERAQKVPIKILFPLIVCLLPALLLIVVGPGSLSIAQAFFGR